MPDAPEATASSAPESATAAPDTATSTPESGVTATPAAESGAAAGSDPFDSPDTTTFDRAYVTKLREEAASRRTAVKHYEDAFSAYSDEQRAGWLSVARGLASEDDAARAEAAEVLLQVAQEVLGADHLGTQTGEKPAGEPDLGEKQFLTEEQLEAKLVEREQAAALQKEIAKVNEEVTALGYKEGTPDYQDLMWRAVNQHNHDIAAAHAARESERQAWIDSYLAEKAGQAGGTPGVPGAGVTGQQPTAIKDFKQSRASLEARIAAMNL